MAVLLPMAAFGAKRPAGNYRVMSCNIRITGLADDAPYP